MLNKVWRKDVGNIISKLLLEEFKVYCSIDILIDSDENFQMKQDVKEVTTGRKCEVLRKGKTEIDSIVKPRQGLYAAGN